MKATILKTSTRRIILLKYKKGQQNDLYLFEKMKVERHCKGAS